MREKRILKRVLWGWALAALFFWSGGMAAAESALGGYVLQSLEDGSSLETSSLKGPLLVTFFTPNCPYCKTELRQLDAMYAAYTL